MLTRREVQQAIVDWLSYRDLLDRDRQYYVRMDLPEEPDSDSATVTAVVHS